MSSVLCCLDTSSHVSEAVPGCGVLLCGTGTRAGLRPGCLATLTDASLYFIQEEFKALLRGRTSQRTYVPTLVVMWLASPYLRFYTSRAIFTCEAVWKFRAPRLTREAAGSCDCTRTFWDALPASSLCVVRLASAPPLPGRFVCA